MMNSIWHEKAFGLPKALDKPYSRVRWLGAAVCAMAISAVPDAQAGPRDGLPQRNLLVEWRMSGQGQIEQRQQGIRNGQIIVDSRGNVTARAGLGATTLQTESQTDTVQQVQVLNGGQARLYFGRNQPYTSWQWAGPAGGGTSASSGQTSAQTQQSQQNQPYVYAQTTWIDTGQGLSVRPRWPGGRSPVQVEFQAEARGPAQAGSMYGGQVDPDGQTRRFEASSTVSVPLGEWVTVARSGGRAQAHQPGVLSTRDIDDSQVQTLEIRITAP